MEKEQTYSRYNLKQMTPGARVLMANWAEHVTSRNVDLLTVEAEDVLQWHDASTVFVEETGTGDWIGYGVTRPAGLVAKKNVTMHHGTVHAELGSVITDPRDQGKGIAREGAETIIADMRANGERAVTFTNEADLQHNLFTKPEVGLRPAQRYEEIPGGMLKDCDTKCDRQAIAIACGKFCCDVILVDPEVVPPEEPLLETSSSPELHLEVIEITHGHIPPDFSPDETAG